LNPWFLKTDTLSKETKLKIFCLILESISIILFTDSLTRLAEVYQKSARKLDKYGYYRRSISGDSKYSISNSSRKKLTIFLLDIPLYLIEFLIS